MNGSGSAEIETSAALGKKECGFQLKEKMQFDVSDFGNGTR